MFDALGVGLRRLAWGADSEEEIDDEAMALALDRKPFIGVLSEGQADIGAAMLPPPEGLWGMPSDRLAKLPGYDPDVAKSRAEARNIMQHLGYGPDKPLAVKVSTRNIPLYRDPAVMLIDQLREIYFAGELDIVETANWNPNSDVCWRGCWER